MLTCTGKVVLELELIAVMLVFTRPHVAVVGVRRLKCLCLVRASHYSSRLSLISNYENGKLHSIAVAVSQWDNRRAGA
ncbi:unnamed protein product [Lota lota]